jgi:hypothetical protein
MQLNNVGIVAFRVLRRHMIRSLEFIARTYKSAIKIKLQISI